MTVQAESGPSPLILPPVFTGLVSTASEDAFTQACRAAGRDGAGALIAVDRAGVLDLAVVLAPDEPLASARRAFLAGMCAVADAVGAHAPPEMPIALQWPDTLVYDGARLGGGRLGWPVACGEDSAPDWLVFSATLIASKAHAGDPGLTPGSTSLEEEGLLPDLHGPLVESFARNLMKAFEVWEEDGFATIAERYLARLVDGAGEARRIDGNGDCLVGAKRLSLLPALRAVAWRDPETGTVRL